jgi:hypothetical protein
MKLTDRLSVWALGVSLVSIVFTALLAIFTLYSQQNFELRVAEVEEIKDLRKEIITLVETEAKCFAAGDLTDLGGGCEKDFVLAEPLATAAKIRLMIYKRAYLFDKMALSQFKLTDEFEPFSPEVGTSYEMDGDEFLTYLHVTLKTIDAELSKKRAALN